MKRQLRRLFQRFGLHVFSDGSLPPGADWLLDLKKLGLPADATFFDVGANVGQTIFEIREAFPQADVFSFEPISETFASLKKRAGHLSGVRCFPVALGAEVNTLDVINRRGNSVLNSLVHAEDVCSQSHDAPIETVTIETADRICQREGIAKIDVLKTDTEGYDLEVLKGASSLLEQGRVRFVYTEVTFCPENGQNSPFNPVFDYLLCRNFRFLGLYETYSLHHFPEPNHFCNALFMRK